MNLEVVTVLIKICKEINRQYLAELIQKSYNSLVLTEAEARRKKVNEVISGIKTIDREIKELNKEYDAVKQSCKIDGIQYFDDFISEIKQKRDELHFELKKMNRIKQFSERTS